MSILKIKTPTLPNFFKHVETQNFIEKCEIDLNWMVLHWRSGEIIHEADTKKECIKYCDELITK